MKSYHYLLKMKSTGVLLFVFIVLFYLIEGKLFDNNYKRARIVTALIQNSFDENSQEYDHNCTVQKAYECLVKCDCSKDPMKCSINTCMYVCSLFSKPKRNCAKDAYKEGVVLSLLGSNNKHSKNSVDDCHKRCPWSTHCDQCPNCKWCWLCSSCSVPNYNCKYCRACNGARSDCAKCCGY